MSFLRADVTDLSALESEAFDVVYTGGHVAVWVSDLDAYYAEAARILVPGGRLIVAEYHPFRRLWQASRDRLSIKYPYFERGPVEYDAGPDILRRGQGSLRSYEFHWTVADYFTAVLRAGLRIVDVHEFGEAVADWEGAPMHGLPEFLLIVAEKPARGA
jgi:ubiquinone/menaquinone biosynthesis C-methylase UbiE